MVQKRKADEDDDDDGGRISDGVSDESTSKMQRGRRGGGQI
jgi:hypothetical protein